MNFAELERSAWTDSEVARAYAVRFRSMVEAAIEPLLTAAGVGSGDRVLDIACGPGRVADAARRRGARVTLLDFSRAMLRQARAANPGAPLVEADAARVPLRAGSVDALVCNFGLLHLPDPDAALREAARLLVPGGRTAWSVWAADAAALQLIPRTLAELDLAPTLPEGPPFFRFAEPSEFESALRSAGLEPGPSRLLRWSVGFDSPGEFLHMFEEGSARTRASLRALAAADRERLYRRLEEKLEAFRSGTSIELPTAAVVGHARASG